jgi:hypothetical protein
VGNAGSGWLAMVDRSGTVAPRAAGCSLQWWIGADDRWHIPRREAAVRQRLVDNTPVVETWMRVPGGDAVHRAYAVKAGADLVVVEIENRSPVPFAVALVVGPPARAIELGSGNRTIGVDGCIAIDLPTRPLRMAGSTGGEDQVERVVTEGGARGDLRLLRSRRRLAAAAFLFPLAHTATLRVVVRPSPGDPPNLAGLPSAAAAATAWVALGRHGMRVDLPSGLLADAYEAVRRLLVLFDPPAAPSAATGEHALARARDLLAVAGATFAWPEDRDGRCAAEFAACVRALLVSEDPDEGTLAVCSALPGEWIGQNFEVHEAPTTMGRVSYAVRWHGQRPALLWDLGQAGLPSREVVITAPGLDPSFRSTDRRGEVLLGRGFHPPVTSAGA